MFKGLRDFTGASWAVLIGKDKNAPVKKQKKKRISKSDRIKREEALAIEKEKATNAKEAWFTVVDFDVDYDNLSDGAFEFDWNDLFITKLIRAGYRGKVDADLVDQWFTQVCRNVVKETYEQKMADPQNRKLEDGRREYK